MKISKKGFQLSEVPQLVIVFMVIAVLLGVGATVLTNVRTTQTSSDTTSNFYQTTATATNASAVTYNNNFNTLGCTGVKVFNGTSREQVTSEFTFTSGFQSCTLKITGGNVSLQGKTVYINYTKTGASRAFNITNTGLNAQSSLSGWQGTWVVIVAAAIILGLIYRYMLMP